MSSMLCKSRHAARISAAHHRGRRAVLSSGSRAPFSSSVSATRSVGAHGPRLVRPNLVVPSRFVAPEAAALNPCVLQDLLSDGCLSAERGRSALRAPEAPPTSPLRYLFVSRSVPSRDVCRLATSAVTNQSLQRNCVSGFVFEKW